MPFRIKTIEQVLDERVDTATKERLLAGGSEYEALKAPRQKAGWVRNWVERLEGEVGVQAAGQVMEGCGRRCIGATTLDKARKIQASAEGFDDLLDRLNQAHIGGGQLRRAGDAIHATYERCYCGSVNHAREPFSPTYCRCSCGWYKQLFEALLERPVEVELLGSIAQGADDCRFVIHWGG